ncbi:hypothetical protein GCM10027052_25770 [Parafrigoribacterium mesophilum]|uniref:hypothetical protein n=1 Tax=Parafrigoribacterium mesophilum TaxID=433646 RepID=UPI0031FDA4E1
MSEMIPAQTTIGEAWLAVLNNVSSSGGHKIHVLSTVTDPSGPDNAGIRSVADAFLVEQMRGDIHIQPVDTVAGTIFSDLYRDPGVCWSVDMPEEDLRKLDHAAAELYRKYLHLLPELKVFPANNRGTYFGRMISFPGKKGTNVNQLEARIKSLRSTRKRGWSRTNINDLVLGGEGQILDDGAAGVQVYAADDNRPRGFPCLVHIDISVFENKLNIIATYRHQYLITKGYGNMIGLAKLQKFLSQQTGYPVGELSIMATMADAEHGVWSGRHGVKDIVRQAADAAGIVLP